jgi:signal transduction histidine kinase
MTSVQRQHIPEQEDPGERNPVSLLQEGQDRIARLSQHLCLLERRLRLGADPADLLVLAQDIKFAIDDLRTLFQSVSATVASPTSQTSSPAATEAVTSLRAEGIDLSHLFSRCVNAVRQRAKRTGVALVCDIASDLPSVTADPKRLEQVFSLLLGNMVSTGGRGSLEVRVCWNEGVLVVDVYDAGRGISMETYVALRKLVEAMDGTIRVARELGVRSRVEFMFPPVQGKANSGGKPQAHGGKR